MSIFNFFGFGKKQTPASVAKERLQIIVSHESGRKNGNPDIIKQLQKEIIEVLSKYIKVDQDLIKVQLERHGDQSVLELNVTLPEGSTLASKY
ncbi:MAG: cell division topological specificity factor MinE [Candidatus Berkiellales bacterium]